MPNDSPTHWTEFDSLYDLEDPRPYFRGVETSDYRMPGVLAAVLRALIPVLRTGQDPARLVDFACGYGAVGLCLRNTMTMADLYRFYATDAAGPDRGHFSSTRSKPAMDHEITGLDIARNALAYAQGCGAIDQGLTENVLEGTPSPHLQKCLNAADLVYESGAIGDHVSAAMDAILKTAAPAHPALLLCPRPRVGLAPLRKVLERHGYTLHVLIPGVRYRRAFSPEELAEEVAQGIANGLTEADCTVSGYFRVDIRLALPKEADPSPFIQAVAGMDPNAI